MLNWIVIGISYLIGSLIFSFLVGKLVKGIDIRKYGSGNAGATNTLRVLGKGPAIAVLVLDVCKGVLAVCLGGWFAPDELWVQVLCGLAVIVGHNWPVYFGFRGGKGIATTIGVMFTLSFLPALIAGLIALLFVFITRYVSLGSLIFTGLLPLILLIMDRPLAILYASLLITCFAYTRHRSNIVKLVQGKENKLGSSSK